MPDKADTSSEQQLTIQQALDLAVKHHKAGELPKAENIYNQILEGDPNQSVALHLLGVIAHQGGENEKAVELITKALKFKPDYAEAHNNLGLVLMEQGNIDEAVASYQKALVLNTKFAEAYNNIGVAFKEQGLFDKAITFYNKALEIKPDYPQANYNLGLAFHKERRLAEAISHYYRALEMNPDYAEAYHNIGNILFEFGKLEHAIQSYQKAIACKPKYAEALTNLGIALAEQGNRKEAVLSFRKAVAVNPGYNEAFCKLGKVFQNAGQLDEAIASYRNALTIKPNDTEAHNNLGHVFKAQDRLEEAIKSFEKADNDLSRPHLLICVYVLGEKDRFYKTLKKITLKDKTNRGVAAISAFASNQFGRQDPYPFCNRPLEFVYVNNVVPTAGRESGLHHRLQKNIADLELDGRNQTFLKSGVQSSGNLFLNPQEALADLNKIIRREIAAYKVKYKSFDGLFIKKWPIEYTLHGWYILMQKGGLLESHNHPEGWLSGVFYLKMPPTKSNEGCIEFSLHTQEFPILNPDYPRELYKVKEGDLVLFPSSLFHRTIPFYSDEERLCIAFDLIPSHSGVRVQSGG